MYATKEMTSPPLSPVAKSAHLPETTLTLNEPARRSLRVGLMAVHSLPLRRPAGKIRLKITGRHYSAARLTAGKSIGGDGIAGFP
jgi:hypothetical protein